VGKTWKRGEEPPSNPEDRVIPKIPKKKLFVAKFRTKGAAASCRVPYLTRGLGQGLVRLSRKQKRNLNKKWATDLIEKAEGQYHIDIDKKVIFARPERKFLLEEKLFVLKQEREHFKSLGNLGFRFLLLKKEGKPYHLWAEECQQLQEFSFIKYQDLKGGGRYIRTHRNARDILGNDFSILDKEYLYWSIIHPKPGAIIPETLWEPPFNLPRLHCIHTLGRNGDLNKHFLVLIKPSDHKSLTPWLPEFVDHHPLTCPSWIGKDYNPNSGMPEIEEFLGENIELDIFKD